MVSVCTVPASGGRSCEHFGGYKTINRIHLPVYLKERYWQCSGKFFSFKNYQAVFGCFEH